MEKQYTVTKRIRWEAGHRLMLYKGSCHSVHGHSYFSEITIATDKLDANEFVIDFTWFRKVKGWIMENWDHGFLHNCLDLKLVAAMRRVGSKTYAFPGEPTAENIAKRLHKIVSVLLPVRLDPDKMSIRVYETFDSWADFGYNP